MIDAVGGIEVDVTEEELPYVNGYAVEIIKATGKIRWVNEPGLQTLNGVQATAYARIRYTAGDDFKRAERQRDVLAKVIEKLQGASLSQINKIIDKVFPEVSTNLPSQRSWNMLWMHLIINLVRQQDFLSTSLQIH